MKNQQILFTAPAIAELLDAPLPSPLAGQVLVRTEYSTVSAGTERALVSGNPNIGVYDEGSVVFPRQSGYSSSGVVVAVGEGVTSVCGGDRVAVFWGCHARYQLLDESRVVLLPDGVSMSVAALAHIACFPLAALRKCHLELGESVLVMGLGVLGMIGVREARAAGAHPIIAADPVPEKRKKALELGADYALDPLSPDFSATVKQLTRGGTHVALEITGIGAGLDGALDCMRKFGRVALLGCTRNKEFTIDYYRKVHGPGITLVGAHTNARPEEESYPGMWTVRDDLDCVLRLTEAGRLPLADLVEEVHAPTDAPSVYARLCTQKFFPLVQFDWNTLGE